MAEERKTWTLGRAGQFNKVEHLPLTRPAAEVDPDAAMALVMNRPHLGYSRRDDVTDYIKQAGAFFVQAAQDAIVTLAMRVHEDHGENALPHGEISYRSLPAPGKGAMILKPQKGPGCFVVGIECDKSFNEAGKAKVPELKDTVDAEHAEQGLSQIQSLLRTLDDHGLSDNEQALKKAENDPNNYRAIAEGDRLEKIGIYACHLGTGGPEGVAYQSGIFTAQDAFMSGDYCSGMVGSVSPDREIKGHFSNEGLNPSHIDVRSSFERGLALLSQYIDAYGLSDMVAKKAQELANQHWLCFGREDDALIADAAHARVFQSGGLFDQKVMSSVQGMSADIAGSDFAYMGNRLIEVAQILLSNGHVDKDAEFEANDMRDHAYVVETQDGYRLHTRDDNGTYLVKIAQSGDEIDGLTVQRLVGDAYQDAARFTGPEMKHDYLGETSGLPEIPYTIHNIWAVNGVISSLDSIHCVLEETYGLPEPEEDTGPSM
jgi:hypothetical protein